MTTAYALTNPAPGIRAVELNPILRHLERSPVWLVTASSAFSVTEAWLLTRVRRNHPRIAMIAMTVLAATEGIVLANNLRVAGRLRAAHAAHAAR
jgi:hypothetical protein